MPPPRTPPSALGAVSLLTYTLPISYLHPTYTLPIPLLPTHPVLTLLLQARHEKAYQLFVERVLELDPDGAPSPSIVH